MITIDFETCSEADLTKVGTEAYAQHPSTEVICACWGVDDEPIQEWWPTGAGGDPNRRGSHADQFFDGSYGVPRDLARAISNGHLVEAHHVAFERMIWLHVLATRYGWPMPGDAYWRCTMAAACYYGLPAALNKLSRALGFGPKDPRGARLITMYSKLYLKTAKRAIPDDDFREWIGYCKDDVRREQSVGDFMGHLPERELPVWQLDQAINMRGLRLDLPGIAAASIVVDQREEELTKEFRELTGLGVGQLDRIIAWCAERGVALDNMQADYLEDLVGSDLSQGDVRRVLEVRLAANKASTKKLDAMARQVGADGRARYQTRYHGAVTGRNTGSGFQPLNLARSFDDVAPEQLVRDIVKYRDPRWLDAVYGDAMDAVSKASRHWITAAPGSKIISGDYSSIEAVILACLTGEERKIERFRLPKPRVYENMGEMIHKLEPGTVTKMTHPREYKDGKTLELAGGYQGWVGAWLKFDKSGRYTDEEIAEKMGAWRDLHPAIVQFWGNLERAAEEAIRSPGSLEGTAGTAAGYIMFECVDEWLTMILPDGKRLWYWKPELRSRMPHWHRPEELEECAAGTCGHEPKIAVSYMAQKTGKWGRVFTYGGRWAENATQATARQFLVAAAQRVSDAWDPPLLADGYLKPGESSIVLTVYDEIVVEVPEDFATVADLETLMLPPPGPWADNWPIRVSVWEGERYKK